jgi:hypothetical protein
MDLCLRTTCRWTISTHSVRPREPSPNKAYLDCPGDFLGCIVCDLGSTGSLPEFWFPLLQKLAGSRQYVHLSQLLLNRSHMRREPTILSGHRLQEKRPHYPALESD